MEQYYSTDSFKAYKTEDGIYLEEQKKGSLKMLLFLLGLSVLLIVGGFLMGILGGNIGRIMAPILIWGGAILIALIVVVFVIKLAIKTDPKMTFSSSKKELSVRGKVYAYSSIEQITYQVINMMGRTMFYTFIIIGGKKKTFFSSPIAASDPKEMEEFMADLDKIIQDEKNKTSAED